MLPLLRDAVFDGENLKKAHMLVRLTDCVLIVDDTNWADSLFAAGGKA